MNNKWNAYDELALLVEEYIDNMICGSAKPINEVKAYQACHDALTTRLADAKRRAPKRKART